MSVGTVLGFTVEWFDPVSLMVQNMYLKFFLDDNTIELLREKAAFLKRIFYPDVSAADLFVGNTITVHNRIYTITGYANRFTQDFMEAREVHFVAIVEGGAPRKVASLLNAARRHKLQTGRIFTTLTSVFSDQLIANDGDTAVELVGTIATKGHYDAFLAEVRRFVSIAQLTVDAVANLFRDCRGPEIISPCTLCLIKPHLIRAGRAGEVLDTILDANFGVAALFSIHLTVTMAEELFLSYRGVVKDYALMIDRLCAGPSLAIMVVEANSSGGGGRGSNKYMEETKFNGRDLVSEFREFCGPNNPHLAKVLRPKSLRALFGVDPLDNALHCTDLPEDGEMECRYFFQTIANL